MCILTFDHDTPCVTVSSSVTAGASLEVRRLQPGESARTDIGRFTLVVTRLAASDRIARVFPKMDSTLAGVAALVAALLLSFVGWAAYARPPTAEVTQRFRVEPLEVSLELKSDGSALPEDTAPPATRHDVHRQQKSREGIIAPQPDQVRKRVGVPNEAARARRRAAVQGPKDNPDTHVARREGDYDAWISTIGWDSRRDGERLAPIHPLGRDTCLGIDDYSIRAPNLSGKPEPSLGDEKALPNSVAGHLHKTLQLIDVQPLSESAS